MWSDSDVGDCLFKREIKFFGKQRKKFPIFLLDLTQIFINSSKSNDSKYLIEDDIANISRRL